MKSKIMVFLVIFSLLMIPTRAASAAGDARFDNLGLNSPLLAVSSPVCSAVAPLNRASLDAFILRTGNLGYMRFSGVNAALVGLDSFRRSVFSGSIPLRSEDTPLLPPPPSANCDSWISQGIISLVATKDAPTNPVVVSQDPNRGGVNLTWMVHILPTTYTYGLWEQIPYPNNGHCKTEHAECAINNSGKPCCTGLICVAFNPHSGNGKCAVDPNMPPIWACVNHVINYQEEFISLTPQAVLTTASRNWILYDLAKAYPGSFLKHPDWGFTAIEPCVWDGDTCVWTHSESHVQVVDPGYYDLMITGTTSGTDITPPREFSLSGGHFGVYLMENSKTG